MSNPRIEEVSDSDIDSDPEIDDPDDFLPNEIMRRADAPSSSQTQTETVNPTLTRPPPPTQQKAASEAEIRQRRAELKPFVTIYPIYFSSSRSKSKSRKVASNLTVSNPLAFSVLRATQTVLQGSRVQIAFEPDKTHPKDWSNPGRVKVRLYDEETHEAIHPTIKTRKHLYNLISKELQAQGPTKPEDPLELKIHGLPIPENFMESKVAVPRGWKMGNILPVHSAAVSGGGVSDNFFKDAMEEMKQMQGAGGAGPGGMDMSQMAQMMQSMGGMGGMGALGGGGGGAGSSNSSEKKKDKKKG